MSTEYFVTKIVKQVVEQIEATTMFRQVKEEMGNWLNDEVSLNDKGNKGGLCQDKFDSGNFSFSHKMLSLKLTDTEKTVKDIRLSNVSFDKSNDECSDQSGSVQNSDGVSTEITNLEKYQLKKECMYDNWIDAS